MDIENNIQKARTAIESAEALFITAGAGMGVDSGLPDFRGNQGFWKAYPPIAKLGISFVEMANPHWFEANPPLAWGFYGHRLNLYRKTKPHKGFQLLLDIAKKKPGKYFVFTSNVDGQFQKAGFAEERIEECHGSILHLQCLNNCTTHIWKADKIAIDIDKETFEAKAPLPGCPYCGGLSRPNILMFGDWGWNGRRSAGQSAKFKNWISEVMDKTYKLTIIEIGAGNAVPTVRYQSEEISRITKAPLIRINPRDFSVPVQGIPIPLGGNEAIIKILQ